MCLGADQRNAVREVSKGHDEAEFRHLVPEQYWGGCVSVPDPGIEPEQLRSAIATIAREQGITFSGFLCAGDSGELRYEISRYPRRAFGPVASIETCEANLGSLVSGLRQRGINAEVSPEPIVSTPSFRVILGLEEGYLNHERKELCEKLAKSCGPQERGEAIDLFRRAGLGEQAESLARLSENREKFIEVLQSTDLTRRHSVQEVITLTAGAVAVKSAEIFTAGSWGQYQESAAVVTGPAAERYLILQLAATFHQARIAIEEFGPTGATAHMVEIRAYCTDPDEK